MYAFQLCRRGEDGQLRVLQTYNEDLPSTDVARRAKELLRTMKLDEPHDTVRVIQLGNETRSSPVVFVWTAKDHE
jgi:hypothetical protein